MPIILLPRYTGNEACPKFDDRIDTHIVSITYLQELLFSLRPVFSILLAGPHLTEAYKPILLMLMSRTQKLQQLRRRNSIG